MFFLYKKKMIRTLGRGEEVGTLLKKQIDSPFRERMVSAIKGKEEIRMIETLKMRNQRSEYRSI